MPKTLELLEMLKLHEGFRREVYIDTTGNRTIGYGHNLEFDNAFTKTSVSEQEAEELLKQDIQIAAKQIKRTLPAFDAFSPNRQNALTDMIFNMGGTKFKTFKKMIKAIENKNWEEVAIQAKDSRWYRQVKSRGVTIVRMLREG